MQLAVQTGSSQQRRVTQSEWAKFRTEEFWGERGHVAVMTVNTTKVSFSQISGTTGCNSGKCVGILLIVLHIFDHIWFNKSTGQVGTLNTRAEVDEICPLSILKCLRYWRLDESHKLMIILLNNLCGLWEFLPKLTSRKRSKVNQLFQ